MRIPRKFYAKHIGILDHYHVWTMPMIAVYDVLVAKTLRVEGQPGISKGNTSNISKILDVKRETVRKALRYLSGYGYIRRHPEGWEIVNFNGDEPVGVATERPGHETARPSDGHQTSTKRPPHVHETVSSSLSVRRSNKEKREAEQKKIALEWVTSLSQPDQDLIAEVLQGVTAYRKTNILSEKAMWKILWELSTHDQKVVIEACRRYIKQKHAGKHEKYLYGIVRGVEAEARQYA